MATIRSGHYVKSAEGTVYRVRYVGPRYDAEQHGYTTEHYADVVPLDNLGTQDTLTLPVSELRRVPDPSSKRPPIEGMPEDRPVCQFCGKRLNPVTNGEHQDNDYSKPVVRRTFQFWSGYPSRREPLFHSMLCAVKFAAASHRAGYRIVKP